MGPILVTGVPRSGNTWLARLLAKSARHGSRRPGADEPSRSPIRPGQDPGRLGPAHRPQPATSASCSARPTGAGTRSSTAGSARVSGPDRLRSTRVVVKDPYAMLSMRAVVAGRRGEPGAGLPPRRSGPGQLSPGRVAAPARRGRSDRRQRRRARARAGPARDPRGPHAGRCTADGHLLVRADWSWR